MTFYPPHLIPYADRSLVVARHSPYHPYQHDSDPDSYRHHSPSRISRLLPASTLKLQDPRLKCDRNLGWSIDWAVAFLVNHLDPKSNSGAATLLKTVRQKATALEREGHALEIPYRYFNVLNNILFGGHLRNAVYLDIRRLNPNVSGATHTHGSGVDLKVKRVAIYLNKDVLQQARSRDIIGTLIHHMIHAYFLVACGPQVEKEVGYGRLDHGVHFGKVMMAIKNLSSVNGRPLATLDFGHSLGQADSHFYNEEYYKQRKPARHRHVKGKWYCSLCYSDVASLSEGDIDEWYNSTCKPLLTLPEALHNSTVQIYNPLRHILEDTPRAEATPSTASKEFVYHGKSVLVAASVVDGFGSIRGAFEKGGSRFIEISEVIEESTFLRFLELLHTKNYGPDPKHIHALGRKGPPVIKSPSSSEPYLLTDIKMYKMGVATGFDELKGTALDRMYRHGITYEDPVFLLKELYGAGEPDGDLKAWTRKFLGKTPTGGEGEWVASCAPSAATEPSNLAKLECDLLSWKARFYELLEGSSALKYEVSKVKRELIASGLYAPTGVFGAVGPLQRGMTPPMAWPPLQRPPGGYLPLPWASPEVEMERRAAAVAAAAADPFLQRGLGYAEDYDDVCSSYGGPW